MRVEAAGKPEPEKTLFDFLLTVRDGRPQPSRPLLADDATLLELYAQPHPDLCRALHHCLDAFLIELVADPGEWGEVSLPAPALGVALAANNCLSKAAPPGKDDQVAGFTEALVAVLPPARERDAALGYHAVLRGADSALPHAEARRAAALRALVERSPLTALWSLDAHTPTVLNDLAAEMLPGWRSSKVQSNGANRVWRDADDWLDVVGALLGDERIARWVRRRWLAMDETHLACRNVGLVLESLRPREKHRGFILEFYEAYDYFRAETRPDQWRGQARVWPILETIEKLLLVAGDSESAIALNRRGNEYFLKFRPLLEIVIDEGGIPKDYRLLSREFVFALRRLIPYITERAGTGVSLGRIEFKQQRSHDG